MTAPIDLAAIQRAKFHAVGKGILADGRTVELYDPRHVAPYALDLLPVELFRIDTALYSRPRGTDARPADIVTDDALAAMLLAALGALPERSGAWESMTSYYNLRTLAQTDGDTARRFGAELAKAARRKAPRWTPPKAADRPQPMTDEERLARYHERRRAQGADRAERRADEEASARVYLLAVAAKNSGTAHRVADADLYAAACKAIELKEGTADERLGEGRWTVPSRRTFYRVAEHVLGARRKSGAVRFFTFPEHPNVDAIEPRGYRERTPSTMHETTEAILARADAIREEADAIAYRNDESSRELDIFERRLALLVSGDRLGALMLQRETLGATGAPLIDLAAERARRAA